MTRFSRFSQALLVGVSVMLIWKVTTLDEGWLPIAVRVLQVALAVAFMLNCLRKEER